MSWLRNKYEETKTEIKTDWEEKRKADKETRKKARAEYYRAREEEQIKLARKKAILESEQRERQLRAKFAPKPKPISKPDSNNFNSFQMSWEPSGINSPSYFGTTNKKKKKKKGLIWQN
ncbi:MAG TPA: hypothetical protein VJ438_03045 [Candidatus Nanoarchaeia archaeon]|nr:hypothetical protein [Candidatus Nanoarchaeia archaeon]